jgi:glycosyltransferase involved in cell wall biosynthesis
MAVPLRIGGGSRLKILEALACGLPVVSSTVGAEGLCLVPGKHYVRADEDEMAAALVQALRQPAAAQQLARQGRELVLATYDWQSLARKLERIWDQTVSAGAPAGNAPPLAPCSNAMAPSGTCQDAWEPV